MSKIKPRYNSEDDPSSLEKIVEQGESERDNGGEKTDYRIKLPACPELPKSSAFFLRHKHPRLTGISATCRFVSKSGFLKFQDIDGLKTIESGVKKAYSEGSELDRLAFADQFYTFNQRLGISRHEVTCRFFGWVYGGIVDWSHTLGLKATTLTIIILVFGLASSSKWIPPIHRNVFEAEEERFRQWVNERASKL